MKVLYPGSFNPWHNGHQHVYDEACSIFGQENVIIGIANNSSKENSAKFTKWCMNSVSDNIVIIDGLVADYCQQNNVEKIIRGVRQGYDLELEEKLSHWNYELGGIRTIYIPTPSESTFVSSSFLKEIRRYRDFNYLQQFIPKHVCGRWRYNTYIPKKNIYYGPSCVGKTTFLKVNNIEVVNCDTQIWKGLKLSKTKIKNIKSSMREAILNLNDIHYYSHLDNFGRSIKWRQLFLTGWDYDFPIIGRYLEYIPNEIVYSFNYIKLTTTNGKRKQRIKSRGLDEHWIKCLDIFYEDPVFCDQIIDL